MWQILGCSMFMGCCMFLDLDSLLIVVFIVYMYKQIASESMYVWMWRLLWLWLLLFIIIWFKMEENERNVENVHVVNELWWGVLYFHKVNENRLCLFAHIEVQKDLSVSMRLEIEIVSYAWYCCHVLWFYVIYFFQCFFFLSDFSLKWFDCMYLHACCNFPSNLSMLSY